jgi:hypothetical protein
MDWVCLFQSATFEFRMRRATVMQYRDRRLPSPDHLASKDHSTFRLASILQSYKNKLYPIPGAWLGRASGWALPGPWVLVRLLARRGIVRTLRENPQRSGKSGLFHHDSRAWLITRSPQ